MIQIKDISENSSFSSIHQFLSTFYTSLLLNNKALDEAAER
jgi:hypothetical protein